MSNQYSPEIKGSYSKEDVNCGLLACDDVWLQTFQRYCLHHWGEDGSDISLRNGINTFLQNIDTTCKTTQHHNPEEYNQLHFT
jgi:hypothetical protein